MANWMIGVADVERLEKAMKEYRGNTEDAINDVLWHEAGFIAQDSIRKYMPVSGKTWKGKKAPAKSSKSMKNENGNLSVTVKSSKDYQYLYFPDDGTNTRRHVGNQQFFRRGGEEKQDEIIERCVKRLINDFV